MVSKEEAHQLQKFIPSIMTVFSAVASTLSGKPIMFGQTAYIFVIETAGIEVICTKTIL